MQLFHPWGTCPYKSDVIKHLPDIQEVQDKFIKPYNTTMSFIQQKSGKDMKNPADAQDILFNFQTEDDMGLIIPDWVRTIYPEPTQNIAAQVYAYHNYDQRTKQINSGYLLKKILDDSKNKIDGKSNKKIYLYSGHESTLGYMLNALKANYKAHVPPYGSAISFEIHRANDQHYVKVIYLIKVIIFIQGKHELRFLITDLKVKIY